MNKVNSEVEKELVVEITSQCPQSCIFCSSNSGPEQNQFLDLNQIRSIIDAARKNGITHICLSGGEPLCHSKLFEIIKMISERGFNLCLYTCGIYMKDDEISEIPDKFAEFFANIPNFIIRVNFQSSDRYVFETITNRKRTYVYAQKSLKKLLNRNIRVQAHIVPNQQNLNSLEDTLDYLLYSGVKTIKVLRFVAQGRGEKNRRSVDPEYINLQYKRVLKKIQQKYDPEDVQIGTAFSNYCNSNSGCYAGINKFCITPDFCLHPCVSLKDQSGLKIESISIQSAFDQIPKKIPREKIEAKCKSCPITASCSEICPRQILDCQQRFNDDLDENRHVNQAILVGKNECQN